MNYFPLHLIRTLFNYLENLDPNYITIYFYDFYDWDAQPPHLTHIEISRGQGVKERYEIIQLCTGKLYYVKVK